MSIVSEQDDGSFRFHPFTTLAWIVGTGLVLLLLWVLFAGLIFGFNVATAGIVGQGKVHIRIQSANNRIEKQELFETLYQDIQQYDNRIQVAAQTYATSPTERNLQNLQGLKQICIDTTGSYNAEARKISSEQFRDSELPYQIDSLNPLFDCKEN